MSRETDFKEVMELIDDIGTYSLSNVVRINYAVHLVLATVREQIQHQLLRLITNESFEKDIITCVEKARAGQDKSRFYPFDTTYLLSQPGFDYFELDLDIQEYVSHYCAFVYDDLLNKDSNAMCTLKMNNDEYELLIKTNTNSTIEVKVSESGLSVLCSYFYDWKDYEHDSVCLKNLAEKLVSLELPNGTFSIDSFNKKSEDIVEQAVIFSSLDDFRSISLHLLGFIMTHQHLAESLTRPFFESSRFVNAVKDTQFQLDLNNRLNPPDVISLFDNYLSLAKSSIYEQFHGNLVSSRLVPDGITNGILILNDVSCDTFEQVLLPDLVQLHNYPDRGFFHKDKIGIYISNFDLVVEAAECEKFSNEMLLEVQTTVVNQAALDKQLEVDDFMTGNSL
jgi:hypothetical protein